MDFKVLCNPKTFNIMETKLTENKFYKSTTFKMIVISILILLLLIPRFMISNLIDERKDTMMSTITEVQDKWSHGQTIKGPILKVPYMEKIYNSDNDKPIIRKKIASFLPEDINISAEVLPKLLNRSLYDVVVYNSDININGNFRLPDFSNWDIEPKDILWNEASIKIYLSDLRGIQENISFDIDNKNIYFESGIKEINGTKGIQLNIEINPENFNGKFNCKLKLKGSKHLKFSPSGKITKVKVSSPWKAPGFIGDYLPNTRKINNNGFSAEWQILHYNRNFPDKWKSSSVVMDNNFGVNFCILADNYQKNTRSIKYSILFIILTFLTFFLSETISENRIHPFQYIMTGMAICIFYLLLLSISEHLGFNISYLISAILTIGSIYIYVRSIFKNKKICIGILSGLSLLYLFIFILLQLENYALMVGSIGIFIILFTTMHFTRKINWYK